MTLGWGALAKGAVLAAAGRLGFPLPPPFSWFCGEPSFLPPLTCFSSSFPTPVR